VQIEDLLHLLALQQGLMKTKTLKGDRDHGTRTVQVPGFSLHFYCFLTLCSATAAL
jgi:hypothetical protein